MVPAHPLDVKPLGNAFTADENIKTAAGSFALLPDELITRVMEWLKPSGLLQLGCTCKALYAFSRQEDLWKMLYLGSAPSETKWQGSWLSTYLGVSTGQLSRVSCKNLFSDALHQPFLCAHTSLEPYTHNIPSANAIARLSNLNAEDFVNKWADEPFILTDPVRQWPVYRQWSSDLLLEKYGEIAFRAEAADWPLKVYVDYMRNNSDESPLYLFDRSFVEKMDLQVEKHDGDHYWSPDCFGEDLFDVFESQRPDRRWLIVGPERSGSTFHKDPNATSAWNAVLSGSKYWIMFPSNPSNPPPPGVYVSEDQSEVTSPLSIAEWLIGFHGEARKTRGCREGICNEGEVLHVPSGWWHLVVNLSPSIAITQNFVPKAHLANALAFLKYKPDQVSGFRNDVKDPYGLFVAKLQEKHPELLQKGLADLESLRGGKKRKWEELTGPNGDDGVGVRPFSFGFGDGDDEDVP
ncbi:MAG: hypothetical protein LQ349_007024 [Xanthoria aureola]|nr:MAG: hypothetical protein LQ349_007024 [Xanthoria aureola]